MMNPAPVPLEFDALVEDIRTKYVHAGVRRHEPRALIEARKQLRSLELDLIVNHSRRAALRRVILDLEEYLTERPVVVAEPLPEATAEGERIVWLHPSQKPNAPRSAICRCQPGPCVESGIPRCCQVSADHRVAKTC